MKKSIIFLLFLTMCSGGSEQAQTETTSQTEDIGGVKNKVSEEEKQLSKWLNRSEEDLKVEFGKPDKINFKANSRNRFYVYIKQKLKIKCERAFEINANNKVVGFTSKNCF